ncbi:MAG: hypothetical protein WAS72_05735 [Saprospiraceae bacterium]
MKKIVFTSILSMLSVVLIANIGFRQMSGQPQLSGDGNALQILVVQDDIQIMGVNEKYYYLLVTKAGFINESSFSSVHDINNHIKSLDEGIIECSYSLGNNQFKLTLSVDRAKRVLKNVLQFDIAFINSKL